MLQKVESSVVETNVRDVDISDDAHLHVKFLHHTEQMGPTLLLIHGGGAGANHTIVERPARWLVDQGVYGRVILPDRRGNGASSPLTHIPTFRDHARDMRALLDALGETGPLDVMGVSYGGPIALTHADIDDRIARVILYASSPAMHFSWPWNWLIGSGVIPWIMRRMYKREIGTAEPRYVDLDVAYEQQTKQEDWEAYKQALNHTPADRLDSIMYEFQANQRPAYTRIDDDVALETPVLRVIGSEDQTWGSDWPPAYQARFPNFQQVIVPGADHKDAIREADRFLEKLVPLLQKQRYDRQF
jgi:pimeloyl-ACP methyl ester carboxylesterase